MAKIKIVVGSNFGDEGKGLMTDYFCHEAFKKNESCIVVLSNGGAQRGHTVTTPLGERHVFHHFGSGSFTGAGTYIPAKFIVNPMVFRQEYEELKNLGLNPKVYVDRECIFTTPFEMILNQVIEESRGENRHGSCGMGIWETIIRNKFSNKTLNSFIYGKTLEEYLFFLRDGYLPYRFKSMGIEASKEWMDIINEDGLISNYISDFRFFVEHVTFISNVIMEAYDNIVFENGQGLLLDQDITGYGENTTPSKTGIWNPMMMIPDFNSEVEICYVTRSYLTRHGAGRFDEECDVKEINPNIYDKTNIYNVHQGDIRYGKMNIKKLLDRIHNDSKNLGTRYKVSLAVTHLNETNGDFTTDEDIHIEDIKDYFYKVYLSDGETREFVVESRNN